MNSLFPSLNTKRHLILIDSGINFRLCFTSSLPHNNAQQHEVAKMIYWINVHIYTLRRARLLNAPVYYLIICITFWVTYYARRVAFKSTIFIVNLQLYLLPDKSKTGKRKTKVKKHTLNPIFDETMRFYMSLNSLESRTLWLTVWHSDMFGRNDFLGEVSISLAGRVFDNPQPQWYLLQERVRFTTFFKFYTLTKHPHTDWTIRRCDHISRWHNCWTQIYTARDWWWWFGKPQLR